jgi:hypothetical protein
VDVALNVGVGPIRTDLASQIGLIRIAIVEIYLSLTRSGGILMCNKSKMRVQAYYYENNMYINYRNLSFFTFFLTVYLFAAPAAIAQKSSLGTVSYSAPAGWNKTSKENIVAFSKADATTGTFCIITLYGATPGTGKPESDFKREWANLVLKNMKADADPKTESALENGWTVTGGGSEIDTDGTKAFALLTVMSGGGRTVSILAIFNDQTYVAQLAAFSDSIDLGKAVPEAPRPQLAAPTVAAPASSEMTAADLVWEYQNNEIRADQQYTGKRVRITGWVNIIEVKPDGQVVLTFKSSIATSRNARCYFRSDQKARVASLNANEKATVEGTVKGLGDGFDNSKAYLVLVDCTVP